MNHRWKVLLALLAALSLFAAACGDGSDDETSDTTEQTDAGAAEDEAEDTAEDTAEEDTTEEDGAEEEAAAEDGDDEAAEDIVRADADLVIWADDTRTPVITPFAETFGEENGLSVAVQEVDFGSIRDRLQTAGPAGEGPDIVIGAHDWLGQLVTSGLLSPVDLGPAVDDFSPVAIEAMTYEGQLYGVPYAVENVALIRNTDLAPDSPATFDELAETALALVESGDADVALGLQQPDVYHNFPLFTGAGGYLFGTTADGGYDPDDIGIDGEDGLLAARKFAEWTESGLVSGDVTYDVMIESFAEGRAPFAITGPWAVSDADRGFKAAGVNYVVERIPPVVDGVTPSPFVGVQGFMVSAQAVNELAAQTFIAEVMSTEEAQTALFEAGGRPPAHNAAFDAAASDPDIQGFGAAGANGQPLPAIPEMGSVWGAWGDAYTLIFSDGAEPEEAFTAAAEQIRTLIAEG